MARRRLIVLLAAGLLVAACTESDMQLAVDNPADPVVVAPVDEPVSDPDAVVDLALRDLESYWTATMPQIYGIAFEPLAGGLVPYGPDSPLPECGSEVITYDDIAENALYCPPDDLIAWDRVALMPALQEQFGPLTSGMVMAHEFAHAVQARADVLGATVTLELQADCFAGAWVADVDGRIATFTADGEALDLATAGLLELRDTVGVSAAGIDAHGSGFDRISAFQTGLEQGPRACVGFEDEPPTVVAIPFLSADDELQGGNLPLDQLIDPLVTDLESFYDALLVERGSRWDPIDDIVALDPAIDEVRCGGEVYAGTELELASFYCIDDDSIYLDFVDLVPALDEIGDFAFGGELARNYAFSAQVKAGIGGTGTETGLHADCLTGVFAAAEFGGVVPDQQLALSPGDLDEIIIAFLAFGADTEVSAFDRTAAFRSGFFDGVVACDALLDG